jgi:hypothetical protein
MCSFAEVESPIASEEAQKGRFFALIPFWGEALV